MRKIIAQIIEDTSRGICEWSYFGHSDIWGAVAPDYALYHQPGGIWFIHFLMVVKGGERMIKIGPVSWSRIRKSMAGRRELSLENLYERMKCSTKSTSSKQVVHSEQQ